MNLDQDEKGRSRPRYRVIQDEIKDKIRSGVFGRGGKIPTEMDLCVAYRVSRMTVNRALSSLAQQGYLRRVPGVGTFVSDGKFESALLEIKNIATEVTQRGDEYTNHVLRREAIRATPQVASALEVQPSAKVFHSVIVHCDNGLPIQLEDRYINGDMVPGYLDTDFSAITPNELLTRLYPISRLEHSVEAVLPGAMVARALGIRKDLPCLQLTRRTWSRGALISYASLTYPGDRYRLHSYAGTDR